MSIKILPFLCLFGTHPMKAQLPKQPSVLRAQSAEQGQQMQQQNTTLVQRGSQRSVQQQQIQEVRNELKVPTIAYAFPPIQTEQSKHFKAAMAELSEMLDGKQPLSLKRAVFLSENAFFDNTLNYERFSNAIDVEVDIIQAFMKKEGYALDDDMAKKYFLQRLMADTLVMRDNKGRVQFTHLPYRYDFDDPFGEKDHFKQLVTKLLAKKTGQCHSLPLLYLILAEALGVKAWLAYSPLHSYIKLQDKKGTWYNYETTNGHYSSNSWILSSGYINATTLKNHVYMDTLSTRQTVAACLTDLATYYTERCGHDAFVLDCADKALVHHPNNVRALHLKSNYYSYLFDFVVKQLRYPPVALLPAFPQADALYKQMHAQYALIDKTGFQDIPTDVYTDWLKSFDAEKQKQAVKIIKP